MEEGLEFEEEVPEVTFRVWQKLEKGVETLQVALSSRNRHNAQGLSYEIKVFLGKKLDLHFSKAENQCRDEWKESEEQIENYSMKRSSKEFPWTEGKNN